MIGVGGGEGVSGCGREVLSLFLYPTIIKKGFRRHRGNERERELRYRKKWGEKGKKKEGSDSRPARKAAVLLWPLNLMSRRERRMESYD